MKKLIFIICILICIFLSSCDISTSGGKTFESETKEKETEKQTQENTDGGELGEDIPYGLSSMDEVKSVLHAIGMESQPIAVLNDGEHTMAFSSGLYYALSKELWMVFEDGEIGYRFEYSFNENSAIEYEGTPVIKNATIDSYTLDLYSYENRFFGSFVCDGVRVKVFVYADTASDISFDTFELRVIE